MKIDGNAVTWALVSTWLVAACGGTASEMEVAAVADGGTEQSTEEADGVVQVRRSPLGTCDNSVPTPPPLPEDPDGQCFRIYRSLSEGTRYLDAYTSGDRRVLTETYQSNDTQTWCFSESGTDGDYTTYRLRHRNASGRYLDAASDGDYRGVVSGSSHSDDSQDWALIPECGLARFKQLSTGRYLDAYTDGSQGSAAVTRSYQDNYTQRWWLF